MTSTELDFLVSLGLEILANIILDSAFTTFKFIKQFYSIIKLILLNMFYR